MSSDAGEFTSRVEQIALDKSSQKLIYPHNEKIGVIVVDNFPALGQLAALRFLEWVQENPGGVISLPTGKTPEFFIKFVTQYLRNWADDETQKELEENGVDPGRKPDMRSLHFVQIDEFYPIEPTYQNSFYYYVNRFYISRFNLDREKAMLMDCSQIGVPANYNLDDIWPDGAVDLSLRHRHASGNQEQLQKSVLEAVDQWCYDYEQKIRSLGGVGFFLGGIGPDGHIAFNVTGSDHNSTTRLTPTNYETQAAAAVDLGGIEVARKRMVITIGLSTITFNPQCVAVLMAAGEAKAKIVRDAVQAEKHIRYPATALHELPNARVYVTRGAASLLDERQYNSLVGLESVSDEDVEKVVVDLALRRQKQVIDLDEEDFKQDRCGSALLDKIGWNVPEVAQKIRQSLNHKIDEGSIVRKDAVFLHTAPHHDDIMLGYLPYAVRHIRDPHNKHVFAYMTSGFTSVTNGYALSQVEKLRYFLKRRAFDSLIDENYFQPTDIIGRNRDIWQYLDGVAADSDIMKEEGEARRLLRNLMELYEEEDVDNLENRIDELVNYLGTQYPGRKDLAHIQQIKGMIREWEADCLWGYLGFDSTSVKHLRLGFYKGEIFTEEPTANRDLPPIFRLLKTVNPDVVTVALDPEASGPDTHYKVLQAIAGALREYQQETGRSDIEVVGYRNVWYRFHPAEANLYVPVSLNMFAVMQNAFMNAFASQRSASFPSYEYDGPFSTLAQRIQVQQYRMLKTCLGRQFFNEHPSPLIRASRGLVFLCKMTLEEFYSHTRELRKATEDF